MRGIAETLQRRSFRSLLLSGTLGLAVLLSASLLALIYYQGRLNAGRSAEVALRQHLERVSARFVQLLDAAEMTAGSGLELTRAREVRLDPAAELMTRVFAAMEQRPELTLLGYASAADGSYAVIERRADRQVWMHVVAIGADGQRRRTLWRRSGGNFVIAGPAEASSLDARELPFFQHARDTGRAGWLPLRDYDDRAPGEASAGITYVLPSPGSDGKLSGVWHADFDLRALSDFAHQVRRETGMNALVLEETAGGARRLVAHPEAAAAGGVADAALRTDEIGRVVIPRLEGSFSALRGQAGTVKAITAGGLHLRYTFALLDAARYPRWMVVLAEPARIADPDILGTQYLLLGAAVVVTLLAVLGALALARWLAHPVEHLRAAVESATRGGETQRLGTHGGSRELHDLADSFERMIRAVEVRRGELQAANAQLTTLLDNMPGVVWALDREGRYILQNRLSRTLHGDCLGRRVGDLAIPDGVRQALDEAHRRAFAGAVVASVVTVPGPLGERHWSQLVAPLRHGAGGAIDGVVGLSFDQTEQRATEQALHASEERVRLHLENTPLAVVDWAPNFRIRSWNHAAEHIFGWSAREALGRSARLLVPPHELAEVERIGREVVNQHGSFRNYLQNLTKDGRVLDCEWYNTVLRDAQGKFLGVSSLVLDVSQRMEAERAFHEAEARFRAAFQRSPLPIALIRLRDRVVLDVNERWVTVYQRARDVVVGKTSDTLDLWETQEDRQEVLRELAAGREIKDREVRLRDVHGVVYTMLLSASLVDVGGERCVIYTANDITDRKETENELMRVNFTLERRVAERTAELASSNARLRDVDRLKSEFLATMSHELRTPLNSILGFTDLLRDGVPGPVNAEQQKQLGLVFDSAQHLLGLINDLLDLSRIEAGRMDFTVETVAIAEVLRDVEATLAPLVARKPIRYLTALAPGAAEHRIRTDRKRVFQILLNLGTNAVKFTEHGEVSLTCQPRPDGSVTIAVRDTGIGMRPDQLARLFEAFRQLDGSRRRSFEGTGLGLHLVKKLVEPLGGEISVESEPGVGSCFTVRLPPETPASAAVFSAPS